VLGYGAKLALAGQISCRCPIVFLLYLDKMYKPMRDLSKMTDTVSKAAVGYERIQEVLEIEARVRDLPRSTARPTISRERSSSDHVQFGYDGKGRVLEDVSFRIEPGQVWVW